MIDFKIRDYTENDVARILELNESLVHFLSPLNKEKLHHLIEQSEMVKIVEVDGRVEAFVLTFSEGKDYDSVNYLWFAKTYDRFLYVDRIVVDAGMHGKGIGRKLYQFVFDYAKDKGFSRVTAEIDIEPANPGSLIFHKHFGFEEVGRQSVADGKKIVSLQSAQV